LISALDRYAFPEIGQKLQQDLEHRLQAQGYQEVHSGQQLADTLTAQLQALSQDPHLKIHFSPAPLPELDPDAEPSREELEHQRRLSQLRNFDINRVERLAGNMGYLQLHGFEPPEFAGETVVAAMAFLAHTSALILDVRHNRGGSPAMVALLCSYLLPEYPAVHFSTLQWPDRTQQSWSLPYVPGARYLNRPVYVLTSPETLSAGEEFAYTLQQLKRATVVGETTAGGANPGTGYRLHDHFWMFLPTGQVQNAVTGRNWEGAGVLPDVKVPTELALPAAQLLGLKHLLGTVPETSLQREIEDAIGAVERQLNQMHQDLISQLGGLR
jgi:C-terminal processing protease CtpA/Prc